MYKRLITTILALAALTANAQTVIEGTVTDSLGHAVDAYVTVAPRERAIFSALPTPMRKAITNYRSRARQTRLW